MLCLTKCGPLDRRLSRHATLLRRASITLCTISLDGNETAFYNPWSLKMPYTQSTFRRMHLHPQAIALARNSLTPLADGSFNILK